MIIDGKNFPDFFIPGAPKSGTTSLYYYLKSHPEIFMPYRKEPWFFCFYPKGEPWKYPKLEPKPILDINEYLQLFSNSEGFKKRGEASVYYLPYYKTTIENIRRFYGKKRKSLKFIIILRNPIDRAYSHYLMLKSKGVENLSFKKAIIEIKNRLNNNWAIDYDYIYVGKYYNPVKAYIEEFGRDNIKVYLYEDLKEKPEWVIRDIFEFLGVDSNFLPRNLGKHYNVSAVPRSKTHDLLYKLLVKYNPLKYPLKAILSENIKDNLRKNVRKVFMKKPKLTKEEEEILKPIFREDILKLQDLIQRDLSHWLED